MKKTSLLLALTTCALLNPAQAETAQQQKMKTCNAAATGKALKGEQRKNFMSTCLSAKPDASSLTPQQEKMKTCNADAGSQGLKGADRKTFMSACLAK